MPIVPTSRTHHQVLASASRTAVLQALRDAAAPQGVADVAGQIGLHPNTVRGHLDVLVDAGYAVRRTETPRGPGRPRVVYEATEAPEDGSNYKLLAEVLAEYVAATAARPAEAAASAGRAWATGAGHRSRGDCAGDHAAPLADGRADATAAPAAAGVAGGADGKAVLQGLVRMLADGGFQPEVVDDGDAIHLRHCPFGELAVTHPDVVCGAHLGIIQASLERLGGPASRARLLPLVQPHLCVTDLHGEPTPEEHPPVGHHPDHSGDAASTA